MKSSFPYNWILQRYHINAIKEKTQRASSKVFTLQQDDDLAPPASKKTKM
jgi:hypothetical protein